MFVQILCLKHALFLVLPQTTSSGETEESVGMHPENKIKSFMEAWLNKLLFLIY